jgi:hypothetical protein
LLPLFVSGMFIVAYILRERKLVLASGKRFHFEAFTDGDPRGGAGPSPSSPGPKGKAVRYR